MPKLIINRLGPVSYCELDINEFMVFTGAQASGKSTIAKSVFLFKNLKNMIYSVIKRRKLLNGMEQDALDLPLHNRLEREIRACFLQIFGTTWCMDSTMYLEYEYAEGISVKISLKNNPVSPNYIWISMSPELNTFLSELDAYYNRGYALMFMNELQELKEKLDFFFQDDAEVVYIPAGRSMITLLSTQLSYIYSSMDDIQKRSLDYCTQNYLERILRLKTVFNQSPKQMIANTMQITDKRLDKEVLFEASELMKQILQGEYLNVDGEERLQVFENKYVKINFASSGQQEVVWILNVLFFYLLNNTKAYFIIEEPESHLFPNAQKLVAEFIALTRKNGNQIFVTTHSPYILGAFNNLLYANRISAFADAEKLEDCKKEYTAAF